MPNINKNQQDVKTSGQQIWLYYGDLLILTGFSVIVGLFVYLWPLPILRVIGGFLYIFFAPGYILLTALYLDNKALDLGQRFWMSFGLSVVVVGLLSLIIVFSIGINLHSIYIIILVWIAGMALLTAYRRYLNPIPESFPGYTLLSSIEIRKMTGENWSQRAEIVTILLIMLAVGRLILISSHSIPQFTEFYLLGEDNMLGNYPEQVELGEPVSVTVGIVNHGKETTDYNLFYSVDEGENRLLEQWVLDGDEQNEAKVPLLLPEETGRHKVIFSLYKEDEATPHHTLYIWVTVADKKSSISQ